MTDRIAETLALLHQAARDAGMTVTGDGRIAEQDAAALIGWTPASLKNARHEGRAPQAYGVGLAGGRISYRLRCIAEWLESHREEN